MHHNRRHHQLVWGLLCSGLWRALQRVVRPADHWIFTPHPTRVQKCRTRVSKIIKDPHHPGIRLFQILNCQIFSQLWPLLASSSCKSFVHLNLFALKVMNYISSASGFNSLCSCCTSVIYSTSVQKQTFIQAAFGCNYSCHHSCSPAPAMICILNQLK